MRRSLLTPTLIATLGIVTTLTTRAQNAIYFCNYYSDTAPKITYADGPYAGLGVGPEIKAQLAYFIGSSTASFVDLTPLTYSSGDGGESPVAFGLGVASGPGDQGAGWFDGGTVLIPGSALQPMTFAVLLYNGTSWADSVGPGLIRNENPITFAGATQVLNIQPIPDLPHGAWQNQVLGVPEPSSLALLGSGAAALLARRRRS